MRTIRDPGLAGQGGLRTFLRIAGPLLLVVGLVLCGIAGADFFRAFGASEIGAPPTRFWMFFVAFPFLAAGTWLTQAGYLGLAARYAAGETMPVVRDSAAYLTDGEGVLGIGRAVDDPQPAAATSVAGGPYCRSCGVRNDADARYCDGCGQSLG